GAREARRAAAGFDGWPRGTPLVEDSPMPTEAAEAAELVFDEATKVYPGRDGAAVDHLSLTVPAGEICVLVGPSGGGKTTALKLVNRLIPLTSGYIRIDGRQIGDYDVTELRRSIGYVIQQVGLFPHTAAGRVPPPPAGAAQDRRLRDARHRRGDQGRRSHRDPPPGRQARPVRHAAADPGAPGGRVRRGLRRPRPGAQGALPPHARRPRALDSDSGGRPAAAARGDEPARRTRDPRRRTARHPPRGRS